MYLNKADYLYKNGIFFLKDGYYYMFTGELKNVESSSNPGCSSYLIHVLPNTQYDVVIDSSAVKYWWVSFFDASGKYLRYEDSPRSITINNNNDYYIVLNLQYANGKNFNDVVGLNYIKFNENNINEIVLNIQRNLERNEIQKYNSDLRYKQSIIPYINGRYFDFNGNFIETNGCCTGFRNVKNGDTITVNSDNNVVLYSWCTLFDKNLNFIRYTAEKSFLVQENEAFICFNVQFKNETITIRDVEKHHVGLLINSNFDPHSYGNKISSVFVVIRSI